MRYHKIFGKTFSDERKTTTAAVAAVAERIEIDQSNMREML